MSGRGANPCQRAPIYWASGGEGGIRTHGPREGTPVFKTGAFNRSATSPGGAQWADERGRRLVETPRGVQPKGQAPRPATSTPGTWAGNQRGVQLAPPARLFSLR